MNMMKRGKIRSQQTGNNKMVAKHDTVDTESSRTNKPVNAGDTTTTNTYTINTVNQCSSDTVYPHELLDDKSFNSVLTKVVCDGLHLTAHIDETEQVEIEKRIKNYSGPLKLKNAQKMKPYRHGRVIYDNEYVIAQVRYKPYGNAGYFFLRLNPSKLTTEQSFMVQGFVSFLLDEPWCSFVGRAKVTMFDATVDIYGINIANIIPVPSRAVQSGFFLKFFQKGLTRHYRQGTEYIGHNTSEKHACIYDKADEQSEIIDVCGGDENVTRIEVQSKPRIRRKFGVDTTTLAELPVYKNPFEMLSISEYPKDKVDKDFLRLAIALTAYMGATAVLQLVLDEDLRDYLKRNLSGPNCLWWEPKNHWEDFIARLYQHPLFSCCQLEDESSFIELLADRKARN